MANTSKANAADWAAMRMCPLFQHIGEAALRRIADKCRAMAVERGQIVFTQGDPADAFFVVLEGWVKIYRLTPGGAEAVFTVLTRGESFAEPVMFLGGRYPVIAEAASNGRLLRIEHAAFVQCLERESDLAVAMLASIGRRADELTRQIGALKLLDAPRRVGEFFLRLLADSHEEGRIELPYEKVLIAARLGMTPESFSRALAALTKVGVTTKREIVAVADTQALRDFVGLDNRAYSSPSQ
ncbi:MAG TPA: Crp/Fnr family transcriptional regulator [Rhodoblastus sp.]|nr:Crp/Fnr family transcriptional regulator [Rhodoblastus sp.]